MRYSRKKLERLRATKGLGGHQVQFTKGSNQQIYANFMEEIVTRIDVIAEAISGQIKLPVMLLPELCYLQLRMICECVALSCLIAHVDISGVTFGEFMNNMKPTTLLRNWTDYIASSSPSRQK